MFWSGVLETAIGAAFGFLLGLVAFSYQSGVRRAEDRQASQAAADDALFRLLQSAALNIETLAHMKMQMLGRLSEEGKQMQTLVQRYYDANDQDRTTIYNEMRRVSAAFRSFYMTIPRPIALDPPSFDALSLVVQDMPALTTFIHRGMGSFHSTASIIEERNKLVANHALENAVEMPQPRFVYYMSMLSTQAVGICEGTDDGLAFFLLAKKQAENYLHRPKFGSKYSGYQIAEAVVPFLPGPDRFPGLGEQVKEFPCDRW